MSAALISYAEGGKWQGARKRLLRTKNPSIIFAGGIHVLNQEWLLTKSIEFKRHLKFVNGHDQGAGLWLWKPFLIATCFDNFPEVDHFIYIDAGCEINLNENSTKKLKFYLDKATETGGVFFQLIQAENEFTSPELLNLFDSESDRKSGQIHATCFIVHRSFQTKKLLDDWINLAIVDEYKYLVGKKFSKDLNLVGNFVHRHDQSILSLLVKKSEFTILQDETYFKPFWRKNGSNFPFWATRNRHILSSTYGTGYLVAKLRFFSGKLKNSIILFWMGPKS